MDFVVVPLGEDGHGGVEGADVQVVQVVAVRLPEFGQGFRHLGLLVTDEVFPDGAVGKLEARPDGIVRVDGIPAVDEKVRPHLADRRIGLHAVVVGIGAKSLATGVAAPRKEHVAAVLGGGHELAHGGFARALAGGILEAHAVEDAFAGRQVPQ